ncbi:MAG: hypothetical protein ACRDTK_02095 [Mycobacterium sp.]
MTEQEGVGAGGSEEPIEGADAGSAEEYWKDRKLAPILSAHTRASELFQAAHDALAASPEEAEALARQALTEAAHAYWFAEGTSGAGAEHEYLHQIGRWTCETFHCEFAWDGTNHRTYCPVKVADKRLGFSAHFIAKRFCSVCDQDVSECSHRDNRFYWVKGDKTPSGMCRVCRSQDTCEHEPSKLYRAPRVRIVRDARLVEGSFVDVPADPLCRLEYLPVETDELSRAVRRAFPDVPAFCDHCLRPYHGLPAPLNIADLPEEQPDPGAKSL